ISQARCERSGLQFDVGERPGVRTNIGMHPEAGLRVVLQPAREELTKGVARPPPLLLVEFGQLDRDVSHRPLLFARAAHRTTSPRPTPCWRCYSPLTRMPIPQSENE